ncbi:MAG: response regulator [Armatimonadetes bacterium]|nr:response regulator [Armatimonadota bacterium]NCO94526.1 response regulator [Armatimonadota bacterium]NCP33524.1 response regulator [Armatimonadota bacterium]
MSASSGPAERPDRRSRALTTGQVAGYCSVSKETVQNWIRQRGLRAQRTAGGQYRIFRGDLRRFMVGHGMSVEALDRGESPPSPLPCWDFFTAERRPAANRGCETCVVRRARARRCHELRNYGGHQRLHCHDDCSSCAYYRRYVCAGPGSKGRTHPNDPVEPRESVRPMKKRVLVIDDELDSLKYLVAVLEDEGYEVLSCQDGDEGLALAANERPDIVLLDIMMPGRSGVSLYRAMRAEEALREVPVILVSGVNTEQEYRFRDLVADESVPEPQGYAEKPINVPRFLSKVEAAIRTE